MVQSFINRTDRQPSGTLIAQILLVGILTLTIAQQTGCAQKKMRPGKIVGGSMAPNALGDHYLANCSQCGFEFPCEIEQSDRREFLVCPNCGFDKLNRNSFPIKPAQQVEIDFQTKSFDRWDLVAFRQPNSGEAGVKRIVGLPGESVEIRDGNLFVGMELLQKEIETQKEMRIMVHDSKFAAPDDQRWTPLDPSSNWTTSDRGRYSFQRREPAVEMDWIGYRHRKCYSHRDKNLPTLAIEDSYGFNQSISRNLSKTDELYLELELELSPSAVFGWRFDCRGKLFEFHVDVEKSILTFGNPTETGNLKTFPIPPGVFSDGSVHLEFSTLDHQLIVLLDNQQLLAIGYRPSTEPVSVSPLSLGAREGAITATRIRIWRDIYYLADRETGEAGSRIGNAPSGYLVLGDNVPISVDSRHWSPAWLAESNIIGKVKIGLNR